MSYVWRNGAWRDKDTGEPMAVDMSAPIALPAIIADIQPYRSPVSGRMVTSRAEMRDDLARTGSRIQEPDESPVKGKLRNPRFAKKWGLTVADEFRDYDASEAQKAKLVEEKKNDERPTAVQP